MTYVHSPKTAHTQSAADTAVLGLIERLEKAEAGSRELDALVCAALGHHPGFPDNDYIVPWHVAVDDRDASRLAAYIRVPGQPPRSVWSRPSEPATTSLDAALALAERVLPGWWWSVSSERIGEPEPRPFASGWLSDGALGALRTARAATPALALCIAILKATTAPEPALGGDEGEAAVDHETAAQNPLTQGLDQ